ncbi:hypothetical protein DNH61_06760 [Paenibacillus sambharensis]|uniref:Sulfotransferase n=1 Tax=Paenibacillus sambharensis TaxID=1803190 RepID=A0A2W1LC94_9BACL|nr:sulfotransferase [Paenibacillus sambharensis]PZD96503.1 hypothetical protein DNH61_06760 [Paenibacillus sambharensis]
MSSLNKIDGPVVIGGVGGSGTRVAAELLKRMGYFMGSSLNSANDNVDFANLFFNYNEGTYRSKITVQVIDQKLHEFQQRMLRSASLQTSKYTGWGWKNPPTHIYLDYLSHYFSNMKYILVIRNGLDMAYSRNQNQLRNWGRFFRVPLPKSPALLPRASLTYWVKANRRAIDLGSKLLGDRFIILRYEDLCAHPARELHKLVNFLNLDLGAVSMNELRSLIVKPASMGRYKHQDLSLFTSKDIASVRQLGFEVDAQYVP